MTATEFATKITSYCIANTNEANARRYDRFFKEGFNGYGITTENVTLIIKELLSDKSLKPETVIEALHKYLISGRYEEISIPLGVLLKMGKQFNRNHFDSIADIFAEGIDNWAHADTMAMNMLPEFILRKIVDASAFENWKDSPFKFQRRCVPVTYIKVMKKDKNVPLYLSLIESLILDKEREVQQGVGWFLREAWKIQPEPVEILLHQYKNSAARLIYQYATEKMTKEYRVQFRADK